MPNQRVVVIGSGIIGLAHAITAREQGFDVTVLERSSRPLGASVRNFGTIWPIGLPFNDDRTAALTGVARWKEFAGRAGFEADPCGSLTLAHSPAAWAVLQEFAERSEAREQGFRMHGPDAVREMFPLVNPDGLRGAVYSPWEMVVRSSEALGRLVEFARASGVRIVTECPVRTITEQWVETASGDRVPFDHLLVAAGDEMRLFFPEQVRAAGLKACRLQMMRTDAVAARIGAVCTGDLTLAHYPAFRDCPSWARLIEWLDAERSEERREGIHVIAAQHADGSITLGDSHEYANDFDPGYRTDVERLILRNLERFLRLPDLRIATRWEGIYLKSTKNELRVVLRPQDRVTMVTAMGGLGMTLSWDLAAQSVARWSAGDTGAVSR